MSDTFKLLGKRILLDRPEKPKLSIELSPEAEAEMEQEFMKKWTRLRVFAVGTDVVNCKPGDDVYVPTDSLRGADFITMDEQVKIMVSDFNVAIVW